MKQVNENEILWAKVNSNAKIPTKTKENAGYDIYACFNDDYICIPSNNTRMISTGLACALNEKYYLQIEERGSTGSKGIKKSAGVVDSSYRGEIFIALTNCNNIPIIISKYENEKDFKKYLFDNGIEHLFNDFILYPYSKAICQGVVHIVPELESKEINYDELQQYDSQRGIGKLGSSKK